MEREKDITIEEEENSEDKPEKHKKLFNRNFSAFLIGLVVTLATMTGLEIGASFLSLDLIDGLFNFWETHSVLFFMLVYFTSLLFGGFTTGYIARHESGKYGIFVGLPIVLMYHFLVLTNALDPHIQNLVLFGELIFALIIGYFASRMGARYGKMFSGQEDDSVGTFLQISWKRWVWFWIPLQYAFANLLVYFYALMVDLLAGWYFLFNPAVAKSYDWQLYLMFISFFTLIPIGVALYSMYRGIEVIQVGRKERAWWQEVSLFIFYFLIVPTVLTTINIPFINYIEALIG